MNERSLHDKYLIQRLERRIHNQRVALRLNWQIMEQRAGYVFLGKEVRSKMLAAWGRSYRREAITRDRLQIVLLLLIVSVCLNALLFALLIRG